VARHTPLSYRWAYAIVVLSLLSLTAAGLYFMGWQIADQATELTSQLRASTKRAAEYLRQNDWAQQYLPDPSRMQNRVADGFLPRVLQGVQSLAGALTGLLVIFFVGLYAAFDPDVYRAGLVKLVPPDRRDRAREVLQKLNSALAHWILGRLISMAIVGILTTLGLWLLGVQLPISLGVIAALLTFIPHIGPILAAVPRRCSR
jgi:predicted PurR-regulated permease PerM